MYWSHNGVGVATPNIEKETHLSLARLLLRLSLFKAAKTTFCHEFVSFYPEEYFLKYAQEYFKRTTWNCGRGIVILKLKWNYHPSLILIVVFHFILMGNTKYYQHVQCSENEERCGHTGGTWPLRYKIHRHSQQTLLIKT